MGYMHIDNLYKFQEILKFRECYALEKIHGTSAHIRFQDDALHFFSGGEKHENFLALFDQDKLLQLFSEKIHNNCIIFGEAYGGKQQGMRQTYGDALKFLAFDVKIGESWLSVPQAHSLCTSIGIEFVDYVLVSTDLESLNTERDKPSVQAKRNGIAEDKIREGVVLRPPMEVILNNGKRLIAKHKRAEFCERKSMPEIDQTKREILLAAEDIANEWVTPMRLNHVIDKISVEKDMTLTGKVIAAMIEDVLREAKGEIAEGDEVNRAIGKRTAFLYKQLVQTISI